MQTDIHSPPSPLTCNTQSGNLCVHTQQYTFCLSVCPPGILLDCMSIATSIGYCEHRVLTLPPTSPPNSLFSFFLYPSHPAYHVPTVSLPINAHRAALQWGWRVPRQQAQYRVYLHACTCQAERKEGRGECIGEWVEYMLTQADRTVLCTYIHTDTWLHFHINVCMSEYERQMCASEGKGVLINAKSSLAHKHAKSNPLPPALWIDSAQPIWKI